MHIDTHTQRDAAYTASICLKTSMCIIIYNVFIILDKGPKCSNLYKYSST